MLLSASFVAPSFIVLDYGRFYDQIKAEYPNARQADTLPNPTIPNFFPQSPRLWCSSEDEHHTVQLQNNLVACSWKTTLGAGTYPGLEELYPRFETAVRELKSVFDGRNAPLTFVAYELNYVNVFQESVRKSLGGSLFPWENFSWLPSAHSLSGTSSRFELELPGGATKITIDETPAIYRATQERITSLAFRATTNNTSDMSGWFLSTRMVLRELFKAAIPASTLREVAKGLVK